jgi:hypothetical protein
VLEGRDRYDRVVVAAAKREVAEVGVQIRDAALGEDGLLRRERHDVKAGDEGQEAVEDVAVVERRPGVEHSSRRSTREEPRVLDDPFVESHAELCRQRRGTREQVDDLRRVELSADERSMLGGVLAGERDERSLGRGRLRATAEPSPHRARAQVTAKRVGSSSSSREPVNR